MKFSPNFYSRIIGGIILAYVGWCFGVRNAASPPTPLQQTATNLLMLCGAGVGLLLTQHLTVKPLRRLIRHVEGMNVVELGTTAAGVIGGLFVGVLLTVPLGRLPGVLGAYLPIGVALIAAYIGLVATTSRRSELERWLKVRQQPSATNQRILLDTSVIVDGRISDVVRTGFVCGALVVPRFVLQEVQQLADSSDDLTRAKGKRGLEVLRGLQNNTDIMVDISDLDLPSVREVDDKLVALARAEGLALLTNDANLQQIAALQQVRVLNINALADAVRVPYTTGDRFTITIRNEGRERDQGVGFLHDGTMVVVEDARHLVGQDIAVAVTRLYTTQTGRILFAQIDHSGPRPRTAAHASSHPAGG